MKTSSKLERDFALYWLAVDGPKLEREYQFCPSRKWRFDFAHLASKMAIEIEGGVWSGGRHTRGGGFIADCDKYNEAGFMGWTVFRLTKDQITLDFLQRIKVYLERKR